MCGGLHMHLPASTNAQDQDVRAKNSATEIFEFVTSSLFQKRFLLVLLLLVHRTRLTNAYQKDI